MAEHAEQELIIEDEFGLALNEDVIGSVADIDDRQASPGTTDNAAEFILDEEETEATEPLPHSYAPEVHDHPEVAAEGSVADNDEGIADLQRQMQLHAITAKLEELVELMRPRMAGLASPEQSPSKQFSTAIHYAKHENNYYLAAKWFRKAAMQGHGKAQFYLGVLFSKGQGVPRSLYHAFAWLSLAACQELPEAVSARKQLEQHMTALEIRSALRLAAERFEQIQQL